MTDCEQIRLCAVVVDCLLGLCNARPPGETRPSVAVKKRAYVTASSDPGLRRIRCCVVLHHNEVMGSVSNASRIVHLNVGCACI